MELEKYEEEIDYIKLLPDEFKDKENEQLKSNKYCYFLYLIYYNKYVNLQAERINKPSKETKIPQCFERTTGILWIPKESTELYKTISSLYTGLLRLSYLCDELFVELFEYPIIINKEKYLKISQYYSKIPDTFMFYLINYGIYTRHDIPLEIELDYKIIPKDIDDIIEEYSDKGNCSIFVEDKISSNHIVINITDIILFYFYIRRNEKISYEITSYLSKKLKKTFTYRSEVGAKSNTYKKFIIEPIIKYNKSQIKILNYYNSNVKRKYTCLQFGDSLYSHRILIIIDNEQKTIDYLDPNGKNPTVETLINKIQNDLQTILEIKLTISTTTRDLYIHHTFEEDDGLCRMLAFYYTLILNTFHTWPSLIQYHLSKYYLNKENPNWKLISGYKFMELVWKMYKMKHDEVLELTNVFKIA